MQGQTEGTPTYNPTVTNALEYRLLTNSLIALRHPVGEDIFVDNEPMLAKAFNECGSLIPFFCEEYTKICGKKVTAIPVAKGATKVDQWLPNTERYKILVKKVVAGINLATELEPVDKVFFVWLQGESDAIDGVSAKDYIYRLTLLKNALKTDINIDAFGIIQVGYFASVITYLDQPFATRLHNDETIIAAQETITKQDDDFILLTDVCKNLSRRAEYINPFAEGHYNNKAMEIIGKNAARTLAQIRTT